jgi:hypothetical protein
MVMRLLRAAQRKPVLILRSAMFGTGLHRSRLVSCRSGKAVDGLGHTAAVSQDIDAAANMLSVSATGASRVGLIDGLTLTRDCLSLAFSTASPDLIILPCTTAEECIPGGCGRNRNHPVSFPRIPHTPRLSIAGGEAPM